MPWSIWFERLLTGKLWEKTLEDLSEKERKEFYAGCGKDTTPEQIQLHYKKFGLSFGGHLVKAPLFTRLQLAWNILRNRPTAYKLLIKSGTIFTVEAGGWFVNCTIIGNANGSFCRVSDVPSSTPESEGDPKPKHPSIPPEQS